MASDLCPTCGANRASDNPNQWCACPKTTASNAGERELSLGKIAREAFDDYWHEDSKGIETDAWEQCAQAVAAAVRSRIMPPCESCFGTGVDGDVGPDGQTIDIKCGNCDGTGRAALASKPSQGEQKPVAWLETHFDGRTRVRLNNPAFVYDQDAGWGYKRTTLVAEQPEQVAQDSARLDWLCEQYVTVRTPLRYGSRECFLGSPDDNDGESVPWDIRAAIDAARARGEGKP